MRSTVDPTRREDAVEAADEVTPLLGAPSTGGTNNDQVYPHANGKTTDAGHDGVPDEDKPMPVTQILVLCFASIAEPVGYFAIVPFISEMVQKNGHLRTEDIGYWVGIIEGLFSVVQMCLMVPYGRLADRVGRKPVLVFSLTGMAIGMTLFGFSRTLWQMILCRAVSGCFAGSVVTTRTMISEKTTKANQGRAFSWYMFTRNLGILLGPLLGGALADPAEQYPSVFGKNAFCIEFPYALASIVTGCLTLSGAILCSVFVKETLVRKVDGDKPEPPMSTWAIIRAPGVGIVLYIMAHIMFLSLAYTAVSPVFMYTDIEIGGFSFTKREISYTIAIAGISQALWILVVFPPLQRSIGTGSVMRICGVVWPPFMALYPIMNEVLRHGTPGLALAIGLPGLVLGSCVAMAFVLGTVNALGLSINSGVRAVAPPLFTPLLAKGLDLGWADGHLVWFFLVFIAVTVNIPLYFLPPSLEGKVQQPPPPSEESGPEDRAGR